MRDVIRQWDSVDRQRTDLRHWLHSKQEEVNDLDQRPSKLHAEAAELDIEKLTVKNEDFILAQCVYVICVIFIKDHCGKNWMYRMESYGFW